MFFSTQTPCNHIGSAISIGSFLPNLANNEINHSQPNRNENWSYFLLGVPKKEITFSVAVGGTNYYRPSNLFSFCRNLSRTSRRERATKKPHYLIIINYDYINMYVHVLLAIANNNYRRNGLSHVSPSPTTIHIYTNHKIPDFCRQIIDPPQLLLRRNSIEVMNW